jgi:inner membrane protein
VASAFGHAAAALAIGAAFPRRSVRPLDRAAGVALAIFPDADVLGWRLGVPYDSLLGHRGLTHSLAFAAAAAALGAAALASSRGGGERTAPSARDVAETGGPRARRGWWLFAFLFLATASHGFLDAATDGGLVIAFFAPFDATRYFLPFRPIAVSPLSPGRFIGARGIAVLKSEAVWIGLPSAALAVLSLALRRLAAKRPSPNG